MTFVGFDEVTTQGNQTMDARQFGSNAESFVDISSTISNVGGNRLGTWGTGG